MDKPRVYSYLRFSDPRQSTGSSADRQTEYARRWAAEHGLVLDEALSMRDEGLSAYHQRHVSRGALGVFLAAIDAGRIAPGSVLIVEGLDRLSRAEPMTAQGQLAQIVTAGVSVVTAADGQVYSRESIKENPYRLILSLVVMIRAHEESDTKSKRVRAAIRRQCEGWLAGTYRGRIRNGTDPAWVRWTGDAFELVPARAEALRVAVELFRLGEGAVRIVRELDRRGLAMTERGSVATNLYKIFKLPALVGTKTLDVAGELFELPGYYPALLTEAEYSELQHIAGERFRRRGRAEIPGIVTGLGITWCGYCGGALVGQNTLSRKRKADGTPQDGHRRMLCTNAAHGSGCSVGGSCSVVPVERALLTYCSDRMNLSALMAGDERAEALRAALAKSRQDAAAVEVQIDRLTAAMLDDPNAVPAAFARKARALELDLDRLNADIDQTERELAAIARTETPAVAEQWAALAEVALALDEHARLQVRQLVADTFSSLVIYHRSTDPEGSDGKTITAVITAKGGATRVLSISRKTGELIEGQDYSA